MTGNQLTGPGWIGEIRASGGRPYAIPAGASDHRLGGLGFAQWAREVERQERELGVFYAHLGGQPALNAYSALFR